MASNPYTRRRLLGAAAAAALLAPGCGPATPPAPPTGSAPSGNAGGAAESGRLRIAGIGFQDDQFFKLVELGMRSAAEELGVEFLPGSSTGGLEKEDQLLQAHIAQRVAAIAIAPQSETASVPALRRAHEAGIKVVIFDRPIPEDFPVATISTDPASLGRPTGEEAKRFIQERLGGTARIAIVNYQALAPEPSSKRTGGFEEQVRTLPGVEIVARQDGWLADAAATTVENILTSNPKLDIVWAANEGGTVGAVTAVKNSGRAGKVYVFGTDMSEQMAGFLLADDNILQAVTGQQPYEIGRRAMIAAVRATRGEPVEKVTALPGVLFTRRLPDEVRKQAEYLRGLSR